jgi:predicted nucleic acid-binding protein
MTLLCDTNIISELCKPQPDQGVIAWSAEVTTIAISVITLEEIIYGLNAKPNARIQSWFQEFLKTYCQVLPVTSEIAQCAGELRGKLRLYRVDYAAEVGKCQLIKQRNRNRSKFLNP